MVIKKILIANRGEIALRIHRTCQEMGIGTIGVYHQEDQDSLHASDLDETYLLEGETLGETYLNQDRIIEIAKMAKADAIHPGFGFLSENAQFADKVVKNNIIFIGPDANAINLMGDKALSKKTLEKVDVPLIPGHHGNDQDVGVLLAEAKKIGFPVLVKASAGGGGKGMRVVESEEGFAEALAQAKRESMQSFGNDRMLIEKYILNPRHVEVQVAGDGHGNYLHFFERECSIQRRYQKIIEESPAVFLKEEVRDQMCQSALAIAKAINYKSVGTVEFIVDDQQGFYFLEMNTRLQVEHPITEEVTGVDLVRLQLNIAQGQQFDLKQDDIYQRGHSVECRLYAENPEEGFLPTIGQIQSFEFPNYLDVRLETGVQAGDYIGMSFDPMFAKVIIKGANRTQALDKMTMVLKKIAFSGFKTNIPFLLRVLNHEDFRSNKIDTHFIANHVEDLKEKMTEAEVAQALAITLLEKGGPGQHSLSGTDDLIILSPFERLTGFRV